MKKILTLFGIAFVLNLVWENCHSFLYSAYKGGPITEFILFRASLFDALLIVCIVMFFISVTFLERQSWLIIIVGVVVAIFNEWYGLGTGRWAYNDFMPIVPLIHVGITPMVQLGFLGYVSYVMGERLYR